MPAAFTSRSASPALAEAVDERAKTGGEGEEEALAWAIQVPDAAMRNLDLGTFARHQGELQLAYGFMGLREAARSHAVRNDCAQTTIIRVMIPRIGHRAGRPSRWKAAHGRDAV